MSTKLRSKVTAILTCIAVVSGFVSLRFAKSAFLNLVERSLGADTTLPNLTLIAVGLTQPSALILLLVFSLSAIVAAELMAKDEAARMLTQVVVLLILVALLAVALCGFLLAFHVPQITIR